MLDATMRWTSSVELSHATMSWAEAGWFSSPAAFRWRWCRRLPSLAFHSSSPYRHPPHSRSARPKPPASPWWRSPAATGSRFSLTRVALRKNELLMSPDKLVYMANQIGKFFISQGHDKAVAGVADHLRKFWDPRMRAAIIAHVKTGGVGLNPPVREAVDKLRSGQ